MPASLPAGQIVLSCCTQRLSRSGGSSCRCQCKAGDLQGGPGPSLSETYGFYTRGSCPVSHPISHCTTCLSNERPATSRAAQVEKHVSSLQAARTQQCDFPEVDLPEVKPQGLADPMGILVKSPGFWADTASLFICSGAFVSPSSLERPFPVVSKASKVLVPLLCVK